MKTIANYGIDAPGVVRNLALMGLGGVLLSAAGNAHAGVLGRTLEITGWWCSAIGLGEAGWMVWGSRVGKLRLRDRLLDRLALRGDERVLDVGCGRGLLLIGAARRLPRGRAVGLDLWRSEDLSGNDRLETLRNAAAEGVAERVEVRNGDMRAMPFEDAAFDVVLSSLAIHNIADADARAQALEEIARVLKPGGRLLLVDFQRTGEYARVLKALGWRDVKLSGLSFLIFPPVRCVAGTRPLDGGAGSA